MSWVLGAIVATFYMLWEWRAIVAHRRHKKRG